MKKHSKKMILESLPQPEYMDKYWGEYKKAEYRIYGDPRQTSEHRSRLTMEWLIKFAQKDLESLSDGDWNNLAYEIACFTELGIEDRPLDKQNRMTSFRTWAFLASPHERPLPSTVTTEQIFWTIQLPSRDVIRNLQKITVKHIIELLKTGMTTFPIPEVSISLSKIHYQMFLADRESLNKEPFKKMDFDEVKDIVVSADDSVTHKYGFVSFDKGGNIADGSKGFLCTKYLTDRGQKRISAKTPLTVFEYHLSDMLAKFALLIYQCPECKTIFLASRKNKQFCSVRCQSRLNMRKYRGTPSERIGKRGRPAGSSNKKEELSKAKGGSYGKTKRKG